MVLPARIELATSALPRMRSTTELRQHFHHPPGLSACGAGPMAARVRLVKAGCGGRRNLLMARP